MQVDSLMQVEYRDSTLDSRENQISRIESSFESFKNQESNELVT